MPAEECDVVGVVDESSEESSEASSSDDEFPSDIEIVKAAKRLAKKLDIEEISFKTFMNRLAERLDLDDLESKERLMDKRKLIKSTVKSKRSHQVEAELPNDAKIKKAGMKLAETINVQKTSHAHFLKLLSSKMGVDLTPKQTIIMEVMLNCMRKAEAQDSVPYMPAFSTMMPCSPISVPAPIPREQAMLDETRLPVAPKSAPALRRGQSHARKTQDLEEAAGIKHAQGLEWEDPFFDKNDELVAVFDHDYDLMIRFWMKVHAVGHVFFLASVLLVMIFILGGAETGMWTLALICEVVFVVLRFYGSCRILKSKVPAYHLAVVREGVLALHDDHINGLRILAALHCFDACLKVSCQSETVSCGRMMIAYTARERGN